MRLEFRLEVVLSAKGGGEDEKEEAVQRRG
jgi:hypothetical protein